MKRRDYIKTILLGSVVPFTASAYGLGETMSDVFLPARIQFKSNWQDWPDMKWSGPEYWGNRLQDWEVLNGKLVCNYTGNNRTLHLLTIQNSNGKTPFNVSVKINKINKELHKFSEGCVGLLIGAKGIFEDFRSAAVFGEGLQVGLTPLGNLKVGEREYKTGLTEIPDSFMIYFSSEPNSLNNKISISIIGKNNEHIFHREGIPVPNEQLSGNFALLSDFGNDKKLEKELFSVSFENWQISSPSLLQDKDHLFGPICFAQYTLHNRKFKLTGQFAPIEKIKNHKVQLEFKRDGEWQTQEETRVTHSGRAINFQIENWNEGHVPYRLKVLIPVGDEQHHYIYEGSIAEEPKKKEELKVAVFSCNAHYGFPDGDIPAAMERLKPDMCVFLGDQFYEGTGGYGIQTTGAFDKKCLDYLRKWMMFGWSYRDIFRHIPCAIIPDDHDVYHGNLWGEKGKQADLSHGFGAYAQDSGGYKMAPDWVNMVQFTQTSHLPDAYDPTPVKNNIGVYYTNWNYGGISFAILEDRKFKSAPKNILPKKAQVNNGWIYNKNFDIRDYSNLEAELLGSRQEKFLEAWIEEWAEDVHMKVVLSQTNFATVSTLPKGAKTDSIVPSLKIPERGKYIKGDAPTVDMDSNGWPKKKRDTAVSIIRKAMAFHIAGDQHLGSFIQYGIDDYEDSSFAFAGPALNNLWPRRFWPPVDYRKHTYQDPAYKGNFTDGFGNFFTLHAVANPYNRHKTPEILYNRANGYGMVVFNKVNRTIKTSCYERFKDPFGADAQYPGWPIIINQEDNYLKNAQYYLPTLKLKEFGSLPVLKVYGRNEELIYAIRIPNYSFQPKVNEAGFYKLVVVDLEQKTEKVLENIECQKTQNETQIEVLGI